MTRVSGDMAGIDVGGRTGRRSLNQELPLVPFIDFLLCLVAFLLVTAVWTQMSRLEATANVPGVAEGPRPPRAPELHLDLRDAEHVALEWRDGATVIYREDISRDALTASGIRRQRALEEALGRTWSAQSAHRAPTDLRRDRAVVHAANTAPFEDIVAAMDAVASVRRPFEAGNVRGTSAAFDVVFAAD